MDALLLHLPTISTVLIGFYFAFFGVWNACHWQATRDFMHAKKIPFPSFILALGIILQTIAGICLLTGFFIKLAAMLLIPFNLVAIFIFHAFWTYEGEIRRLNMIIFIANSTATLAALLLLLT